MRRLIRYLNRPDVKRYRLQCLSRRIDFEFSRRFAPYRLQRERIVEVEPGVRMYAKPADQVEQSLFLYSSYEFGTLSQFAGLVRDGGVVIDIGAHVGLYSLVAARRVGGDGLVIAVEPNPNNLVRLRRNIALNASSNIHVVDAALGSAPGRAIFHLPTDEKYSGAGSLKVRPDTGPGLEVGVRTLDEVLQTEAPGRYPDILKVDVEGAEAEVFSGARRTLESYRPAILLEANEPLFTGGREVASPGMQLLRDLGYRLFGMTAEGIAEVRDGEDPRRYRESWLSLNLLALHTDARKPAHSTV